jgi:hypothetical protein
MNESSPRLVANSVVAGAIFGRTKSSRGTAIEDAKSIADKMLSLI